MAGRLYRMAKVVSANPALWGVVDAKEVSGYKRVAKLTDLYSIAECILSAAYGDGTTDGADAIGQVWHVSENNSDYRLTNWTNRKSASGWTKVTYGSDVSVPVKTAVQVTGAGETNILSNAKITVDAYTKAEVTSKVKEVTDLCIAINTNVDSNTKKITSLGTDVSSLKTSKADKSALDTTNTNLANLTTKVNNIDQTLFEVVTTLPSTTATIKKHIYLVKGTGSTGNVYDEWIYTGDLSATYDSTKWEKFGTVEADVNVGNAVKTATVSSNSIYGFTLKTTTINGTNNSSIVTYPVFNGARQGLVPVTADSYKLLKGDGTWTTIRNRIFAGKYYQCTNSATENGSTYITAEGSDGASYSTIGIVGSGSVSVTSNDSGKITIAGVNTTYGAMTGATSSAAGKAGLVPAPAAGRQTSFLRGDGTWVVPTNTTYSVMSAATASADGTSGLVPAPAAGKQTAFLRGDGTWVVPTNTDTHYTTHLYVGATGTAANGATSNGATYLKLYDNSTARESHLIKGTGATTVTSDASGNITINSTNTTYSNATTSTAGLMSAADKTRLDSLNYFKTSNASVPGRFYIQSDADGMHGRYKNIILQEIKPDTNSRCISLSADELSNSGRLPIVIGNTDTFESLYKNSAYGHIAGGDIVVVSKYLVKDLTASGSTLIATYGDGSTKTLTLPSYSVATNMTAGLWRPTLYYTGKVNFGSGIRDTTNGATVNSATETTGRFYAVASDASGHPFVNVPWTDNNTVVSSVTAADSGNNVNVTVTSSNNTSKTATVCSKLTESEILAILN